LCKPFKTTDLFDTLRKLAGSQLEGLTPGTTLPLVQLQLEEEKELTLPSVTRPLDILLAEDNPVNQKVAKRLLEKQGHRVTVADNGRIAFETYSAHPFDLILMDLQMPEMDGYQAATAIRHHENGHAHTPIIALTAHAMSSDRERCFAAGMDGFVTKPIQIEELKRTIGSLVELSAPSEPLSLLLDRVTD
jgi:CheY-like chemotaxis protein